MIIEAKSTQNLLLVADAENVVYEYYAANFFWVQYPLGLLACYKVNNRFQSGFLTSGTRIYFVPVKLEGKLARVFVSWRWHVAEKYYIRVWGYLLEKADESRPVDFLVYLNHNLNQTASVGKANSQ